MTSHLWAQVKDMRLKNLQLPSSEDIPSLARISCWVVLWNLTGDLTWAGHLGPLPAIQPHLYSFAPTQAQHNINMELDQAATSWLLQGLQHGVDVRQRAEV